MAQEISRWREKTDGGSGPDGIQNKWGRALFARLPVSLRRWLRPAPVTVEWTATKIIVRRERQERREALPPAFCHLNFFRHPLETAEWLRPRLPAGRAASCRWVLPEEAACLQSLDLPYLQGQELREFLRWEGPRSIPWEEGTFYLEGLYRPETPATGENTTLLLVALPKEQVAGLAALGTLLGLATEEVTVRAAGQALPLNFVPPAQRGSRQWKSRGCRAVAVALLIATCGRVAWTAYGLQEARAASLQMAAGLATWRPVARDYGAARAEEKETEARREAWLRAKGNHPSWYRTLLALARAIPAGCRLTEIVQEDMAPTGPSGKPMGKKEAAMGRNSVRERPVHSFLVRGEALDSDSLRRFLAALEQDQGLSGVRLLETGVIRGRQTFSLRLGRREPDPGREGKA